MTEDRLPLAELLQKAGDGDFLRAVAEAVLQLLMESDVEGLIGAGRYERSGGAAQLPERLPGACARHPARHAPAARPQAPAGLLLPALPRAPEGEREALVAVIQEAWIGGVSTRRVDELVQAMGLSGISKSTVSKLCKDIDERVTGFLERPLEGEWPYLWLDATYLKVATAAGSCPSPP